MSCCRPYNSSGFPAAPYERGVRTFLCRQQLGVEPSVVFSPSRGRGTTVGRCKVVLSKSTSVRVVVVAAAQSCLTLCDPMDRSLQASLSFTISQSLQNLMSIKLVMPSNHFVLCYPLLLLLSVFTSIRVFSYESALHMRWPKYWSYTFIISPSNEYS